MPLCANSDCMLRIKPPFLYIDIAHEKPVCQVCFEMYYAVFNSDFFMGAHLEWQTEQKHKRKMITGSE